jgi:hypothetical protein
MKAVSAVYSKALPCTGKDMRLVLQATARLVSANLIGNLVKKRLNAFAILAAAGIMMCGEAQARSLQIIGTAGYLSEWELNGSVTEKGPPGSNEFSGALVWKHVGLCSANGPEEKSGEIKFQIAKSSSSSRIQAAITLNGAQCTYNGEFSGGSSGHMDCPDAKGVPLSISIK